MSKHYSQNPYDLWQWMLGERGKPYISEENGVRSLNFSMMAVQSSMRISSPYELELGYTRAMMGFLLFNQEPKHILLVGLGGGSLAKYCFSRFPYAQITTLEINADVIAMRNDFLIPPDDCRFQVIHTDAAKYFDINDVQADVILLDGFDVDGLPECLSTLSFYNNCRRALSAHGILVSNLLGDSLLVEEYLNRIKMVFTDNVWFSKAPDSNNMIAFAMKDTDFRPDWNLLHKEADKMTEKYRLDIACIVGNIRKSQVSL